MNKIGLVIAFYVSLLGAVCAITAATLGDMPAFHIVTLTFAGAAVGFCTALCVAAKI